MQKTILITGGAGYIGSHITRQLLEAGEQIVIIDNLSTGFKEAVPGMNLVVADVGDKKIVTQLLRDYAIKTVIHLAASTEVLESTLDPLKYYRNNVSNTQALLECCIAEKVENFIFSSSAAVYGIPDTNSIEEVHPCSPINPYGRSKLIAEWMINDVGQSSPMRCVILRYFNVAGANLDGSSGMRRSESTLLVNMAIQAALGLRESVEIFGTDYSTFDGTCIRDYVHVEDVASAHIQALRYLRDGGNSVTLNCGYGRGYSVREILAETRKISRSAFTIREGARRNGDPPYIVANTTKIKQLLNWQPCYAQLDVIIKTALHFEQQFRHGKI